MNKKTSCIFIILLLIELILGNTYLLGFYRGMEECRQIYQKEVTNDRI